MLSMPKKRKRFPDSILRPKKPKANNIKLINDNSTSATVPALPASRASASISSLTMSSGACNAVQNIDQNLNIAITCSASDENPNRNRNNCTTATRMEDSININQLCDCQDLNCIIRRRENTICIQARRIKQLEKQVKQLRDQVQELQNSTEGTDGDPNPSNFQISKTRIMNANTNANSRNFATSIQLEQFDPVEPVIRTDTQRSHTTSLSSEIHTLSWKSGMAETEMTDADVATATCYDTCNNPSSCHSDSSGNAHYMTAESEPWEETYCLPDETFLPPPPASQPRSARARPASLSSSSSASNAQSTVNSQDSGDSNRNSTVICEGSHLLSNSNPSGMGRNKRKGDSNTASISKRSTGPKQKP